MSNEVEVIEEVAVEPTYSPMLYLNPAVIEVDEVVNVRPFSTGHEQTEAEGKALQELIESIERDGQLQPVVVREVDGALKLIAGHRRLQAINIINAGREQAIDIQAVVSTVADPFRAAYDENDKRSAMSPMDKAMCFKSKREREGWKGVKGNKSLAEYFGVNVATVTQYAKLEKLAAEIQVQVHNGTLSMDAALVVAKVEPALQMAVLENAKAEEEKRMEERSEVGVGPGSVSEMLPDMPAPGEDLDLFPEEYVDEEGNKVEIITGVPGKTKTRKTKTRQAKGGKGGISAASVKKAAREQGVKLSRNRKTILEWVEGENGPVYKSHVQGFLTYFLKWADGNGTDKTLSAKFQEAVGKAGMSSQSEVKVAQAVVSKPRAKK